MHSIILVVRLPYLIVAVVVLSNSTQSLGRSSVMKETWSFTLYWVVKPRRRLAPCQKQVCYDPSTLLTAALPREARDALHELANGFLPVCQALAFSEAHLYFPRSVSCCHLVLQLRLQSKPT